MVEDSYLQIYLRLGLTICYSFIATEVLNCGSCFERTLV